MYIYKIMCIYIYIHLVSHLPSFLGLLKNHPGGLAEQPMFQHLKNMLKKSGHNPIGGPIVLDQLW